MYFDSILIFLVPVQLMVSAAAADADADLLWEKNIISLVPYCFHHSISFNNFF
jgi:hypothetical protein